MEIDKMQNRNHERKLIEPRLSLWEKEVIKMGCSVAKTKNKEKIATTKIILEGKDICNLLKEV